MTIGEALKQTRKSMKLSQTEMAGMCYQHLTIQKLNVD